MIQSYRVAHFLIADEVPIGRSTGLFHPIWLPPTLMAMLTDLKSSGATAGKALVNWWRAVSIEAFICAILWLVGLLLIHVPLAPLWALIAGLMTFIPNFGPVIGLLGPVFAILLSGEDMERLLYLLGLYAVIVLIDQLLLQPMLMKRMNRVPVWASLLVPLVLGVVIPFWGVLLAPPLLAVVYAFRKPPEQPFPAAVPAIAPDLPIPGRLGESSPEQPPSGLNPPSSPL